MFSAFLHFSPGIALTRAAHGLLLIAAGCTMASCSSGPKAEVVVSVKDQKMGVYSDGRLVREYPISTSKFGIGDNPGSYRTPLGNHEIIAKIGHGLPTGAVLKSRSWNGEILKPNAPGRDPIVSRILWLRGMESSNRNAMNRYIYIHGTPEESNLGRPASYGCVRMGMTDVVEVFNELNIGAKVVITKKGLPHAKKAVPKVDETPESLVAEANNTPIPAAAPMKAEKGATAEDERANAAKKVGPVKEEKKAKSSATAPAPEATFARSKDKTQSQSKARPATATSTTAKSKTSINKSTSSKAGNGKANSGQRSGKPFTVAKRNKVVSTSSQTKAES